MEILNGIREIDKAQWDGLCPPNFPFARHGFLSALERAKVVGEECGWISRPLCLRSEGELLGATPLYVKNHSYGEYIFDWAWAHAYSTHGLEYYPKVLSAIPFTPATGEKLLGGGGREMVEAARAATERWGASSLHYLFVPESELTVYREAGLRVRHSFQYHWTNPGYGSFEDFLGSLKSRKRKQIRKERREIPADIEFELLRGNDLSEEDGVGFYGFYARTIEKMGAIAYLNEGFFKRAFGELRDQILLIRARRKGQWIGAALLFEQGDTLFGRYWGASEEIPNLHFELCYYRPLEYAIGRGLKRVEAGAQGEHKIARGFLPALTYSAHWIRHPGFDQAIGDFIEAEKSQIEQVFEDLRKSSPYGDGCAVR